MTEEVDGLVQVTGLVGRFALEVQLLRIGLYRRAHCHGGDGHAVIQQRLDLVEYIFGADSHAGEGVDVLEVATAGHAEHGPQVAGAVLRHIVGAYQGLPHVHEHLGLTVGQLAGGGRAAVGIVVHGIDVAFAVMLFLQGDGFRAIAVGVIHVQFGVGALFIVEEDVIAGEDHMGVEVARSLAPGQHHTQAVEIFHHRADGIGHAFARALHHQVGIARLLDDQQVAGIVSRFTGQRHLALRVGTAHHVLRAITLQQHLGIGDFLVLDHRAQHFNRQLLGLGRKRHRTQRHRRGDTKQTHA